MAKPADLAVRLAMGLSFGLFSVVGIVLNCIVLVVMLKNWKHLMSISSWYVLVTFLAFADLSLLTISLILTSPTCLAGQAVYGGLIDEILANTDSAAFACVVSILVCMTLSRFCTFLAPKVAIFCFERPAVFVTLSLACLAGSLPKILALNLLGCHKLFHTKFLFFGYFCNQAPNPTVALLVLRQFHNMTTFCPVVMFCMYLILFVYLKLKKANLVLPIDHQNQERMKRERRLLVQAFIICSVLLLEITSFRFIPPLFKNWVGSLLTQWVVILNSSVNPIVYFVYNKKFKELTQKLFGIKTQETQPPAGGGAGFGVQQRATPRVWQVHNQEPAQPGTQSNRGAKTR